MGSGVVVATESPGVDTEDIGFFTVAPRPPASIVSDLVLDLITFALGRVPSGAMFATTPCRSMPASAKLGRGGAKEGSIHLSNKVFDLSLFPNKFGVSDAAWFCTAAKGLLYRERVGLWVGVLISKGSMRRPPPFFRCDREYNTTGHSLVQGQDKGIGDLLLLYSSTACTARMDYGFEEEERVGIWNEGQRRAECFLA
jgi:hypothetical protein